jgi:hypothetical protein
LHNVEVVETPAAKRYPVPYDFDYSGLVNASYAVVDRNVFKISSVRERVFRGACWTPAQLAPTFEAFRAAKPAILALYDDLPGLTDASRRQAKSYIEDFYKQIDSLGAGDRAFNPCVREAGM